MIPCSLIDWVNSCSDSSGKSFLGWKEHGCTLWMATFRTRSRGSIVGVSETVFGAGVAGSPCVAAGGGAGLLALDAPNNALSPFPNTGFAMESRIRTSPTIAKLFWILIDPPLG